MKKRGQPRKHGVAGPEHLARAVMIMDFYSKASAGGLKHSAAVTETVALVRQVHPEMAISASEVKRVLAELRPQDSPVELRVHSSILEGEEAARRRAFFIQMAEFAGTKSRTELTDQDLRKPLRSFKLGFAKRTNYHRHNAKIPNPLVPTLSFRNLYDFFGAHCLGLRRGSRATPLLFISKIGRIPVHFLVIPCSAR